MLIFAKRRAACDTPENTIAATKEAIVQKVKGIEIDVRLSLDSKVAVCHDKNLLRLARINKKLQTTHKNS